MADRGSSRLRNAGIMEGGEGTGTGSGREGVTENGHDGDWFSGGLHGFWHCLASVLVRDYRKRRGRWGDGFGIPAGAVKGNLHPSDQSAVRAGGKAQWGEREKGGG